MAGTNGFYLPYILRTVGSQGQAMSVALQCASFLLVALGVALVFMPFVDRVNQRAMFAVGALLQVVALLLFALFPLTLAVALGYVIFLGLGGGFAQQPFFQLWSGEMFPTLTRSTAQGLMFAVVFAPSNAGKSLEELERERTSGRRFVREAARPPQRVT